MIVLTDSIVVKNLTRLKVQSVKYEENLEIGQQWAEVWAEYGFMDDGTFYAYPNPNTGQSLFYLKFENGLHPVDTTKMLGRCAVCNKWHFAVSGDCTDPACEGSIEPFPSYNRFRNQIDASEERDVFKATEEFLVSGTSFPNKDDIDDVGKLVEGTS